MRVTPFKALYKSSFPIALFIPLILISACRSEAPTSNEPVVRPVKMVTLEAASNVRTRTYPATIKAGQSAELAFQSGGLLKELNVKEAQEIVAGDIIAQLDQRDFQNAFSAAKATYEAAEQEYQRALRLSKEDAIARSAVDQRKSQRDVAKSQYDSAEKALQDTTIKAPFSGMVATVPVEKLQNVSAGQTIVTMLSSGELEATIDFPADLVATVEQRTDRKAFVVLDVAPQTRIPAEFKKAELQADGTSQTYPVTFSFTAPEQLTILPGMNASMILSSSNGETTQEVVAVPLGAIFALGEQRFVWLVEQSSMTVTKREIKIADSIGETVTVTSGVQAGDTVVAAGVSQLSEGMQVKAWNGGS